MLEETQFSRDGDQLRMLIASPAGAGPHPAIILIPDVRGIYDHFVDVAQRFATEGYLVAVIDLYSREGAPQIVDMPGAIDWMAQLSDRRVLDDLDACRRALAERSDVCSDAIGVTGFCMGGQYALMAACETEGFAACASWYGMLRHAKRTDQKLSDPLDNVGSLTCPFLGLFGANDALIPVQHVNELEVLLDGVVHETEVMCYPDAGHAFFNDARAEMYVAAAAQDAWPRALAFFARHLRQARAHQ